MYNINIAQLHLHFQLYFSYKKEDYNVLLFILRQIIFLSILLQMFKSIN